jgi:hypothetical protein
LARKRFPIVPVLIAAALVLGCGYGMFAERTQRFPYRLARTVLSAVRGDAAGDRDSAGPASGRWRRQRAATDGSALTDEQRAEMERLESIGYLTGSEPAGERSGVTVHNPALAGAGLNLVVSGHRPWAALMEMDGSLVHEWSLGFDEAWPGRETPEGTTGDEYWRRVLLLDDGGVVAIHEGLGLVRLDRNSRLVWAREGGYHHDLERTADGGFCVLDREASIVPRLSRDEPVLEDFIAYLDADGNVVRRFSVLEAMERSPHAAILARMDWSGDIFHTNTIEILDGRLAGESPAFREGNLLISILMLDTVAVVDHESETVVWAIPGMWRQQHQPTVLESGRMLVFDNKFRSEASRVVELDPFSQEVVWSYEGTADRPFYSETCGSNQRLPSGNTLITESDFGRAFEVTPDGTIVWEYVSPFRAGPDGEFVATLFEAVRIPPDDRPDWLE